MTLPWTSGILTCPGITGVYALIGGFDVERTGEPQSNDVQGCAISFNANEYLANTTAQSLNFANVWTINVWLEANNVATTTILELGGVADSSRISIEQTGSTTIRVQLDNAAGTLFKNYTFVIGDVDVWRMLTITWDGTTLRGYGNGVEDAAPTKTTDNADSQTNADRDIYIGAQAGGASQFYSGDIQSIAIWDVALSQNAIREIFHHGFGAYANITRNTGDYSSGNDVVHWWRLGHDPSNIGRDFVTNGAIDVDTNGANITTADIARWSPTGGHVTLATDEILRKGTGGAGGGASTVQLGIADTYSIEVWCRIVTLGTQTIFDANEGDSDVSRDSDSRIQLRTESSNFEFRAFNASGTGVTVTSSVNARADEWYHIVMVKDGTSRMSLYINGVEDAFATASIPTQTDANRIVGIGGIPITPSAFFNGQVHSVAIWDVAHTAANVEALYNGGHRTLNRRRSSGGYTNAANLKHWWRCGRPVGSEGAGGTYVTDQVTASAIDLTANAQNMATADVSISRELQGEGGSVDLDGAADYFVSPSDQTLGFADVFSIAQWVKPDALTAQMRIFDTLEVLATNASRVNTLIRGDLAGDPFTCTIRDDGGTNLKEYRFSGPGGAIWAHFVVTWDGTTDTLKGYVNGVEIAATKTTDDAVALTDRSRTVYLGRQSAASSLFFSGRIGSLAIWNSVLSATEISELYSHGREFDLRAAGNAYASQANLLHLWMPGQDPNDLGRDWVDSGEIDLTPTSVDDTNIKIDSPVVGL